MKSMTGYGSGEWLFLNKKFIVDMKTVNHRFCEVNARLPSRYAILEAELIDWVRRQFSRGRIDIFVRELGGTTKGNVRIDRNQLQDYLSLFCTLSDQFEKQQNIIWAKPSLESFFTLPQVLSLEEEEINLKDWFSTLKQSLQEIIQKVVKMRIKEGASIAKDLLGRIKIIQTQVRKIEKKIKNRSEEQGKKLKERLARMRPAQELDPWRLAQEVVYFIDRTDISEEIQRLKSHLEHFQEIMKEEAPVGKKLDFVLQELGREINTLGSKAQDSEISQSVVICKHEVEKLKEQVQNVE